MKWTYVPQHSPNAGSGSFTLRPTNHLAIARCSSVTRMAMFSKSTPRSLQSSKDVQADAPGAQLSFSDIRPSDVHKRDSAISSGQLEVDFAGDQVGDGDEIA